jgi:serine/threonine protein kinase
MRLCLAVFHPCFVRGKFPFSRSFLRALRVSVVVNLVPAGGRARFKPVETFSAAGGSVIVLEYREGFYTAEQIWDRHHRGLDGRHLGWMFNRILEALGFVHQQGYLHGAVLPPHLLFHAEDHGLLLAGWIHAEKANTSLKVVPDRYRDWYPPECKKKHPATPSVDIYLAAKSLIYLAGGDPVANTFPDHIPAPMQRFLKSCLLESPRMRSQDAWNLRQEFGQVLERLYGPPAFHVLDMS